jgi:hypothetical protein
MPRPANGFIRDMLIEIAETHPPQFGKKVATVVAAGGQKFEIWPEKLAGLQVGASYDVDVADREYNGRTIRKITKATPATAPAATNGNAVPSGEVKNDKAELYATTKMLRGLWGATIGAK